MRNADFEYYSGFEDGAAERAVEPDDKLRTLSYCNGYLDGLQSMDFDIIGPPEIYIVDEV